MKMNWLCGIVGGVLIWGMGGQALQADSIFANPIEGTNPNTSDPYTTGQTFDPNITVSGIGRGSGIVGTNANNRYNANSWDTVAIDLDSYFEWTLTPNSGFDIDFTSLTGNWQRSSSGPNAYALRTSLDSFGADLLSGSITGSGSPVSFSLDLSDPSLSAIGSAITFRLYGWGGTTSGGTFSINDFIFDGLVTPSGGGTELNWLSGVGGSGTWTQTGGTNWDEGPWDSAAKAVFGGLSGTVTVSGNVIADNGVQFDSDGYTVTGGPTDSLQLSGALNAADSVSVTIGVPITGSNPITKTGSGRVVLAAANTFTGNLSINSGTIEISSDANLGDGAVDVSISSGGTLKSTTSIALGAGRDFSGSGSLDIADGSTLTVNGSMNMTGLTLNNTGTLDLQGAVRSIGSLVLNAAATISGNGAISASGLNATNLSDGTATINPAIELGSGDKTINVGAGGTLALKGDVALTGRLIKTGDGILELEGSNPSLGSARIGLVGGTNGGILRIGTATSLGTGQLQFNYGILEAKADLSGVNALTNAISFGSVSGTPALFAGSNLETSGAITFFETSGQQNHIDVNNITTFSGSMALSGNFGSTGLTIGGTGSLILNGDASAVALGTTVTDTAELAVNNLLGGGITVDADATLAGTGQISGAGFISGTHSIGNNDVGMQTFGNGVSYMSGADFVWDLVANSDANAGTDFDQLVISAGDLTIGSSATITLVFNLAGSTVDWSDAFWSTGHTWDVATAVGGTVSGLFDVTSNYLDANGDVLPSGMFSLGINGSNLVLTYDTIPEPSVVGLCFGGIGLIAWRLSRRRWVKRC